VHGAAPRRVAHRRRAARRLPAHRPPRLKRRAPSTDV
jgi:hypothetical protein